MLGSIDRRLATILLIVFVQIVGAGMALPILPLYAKNEFAMSEQMVTVLFSSFFAAQFLAGPWLGRLSDERGRLPVLIASQIGTAISFVMLAMAGGTSTLFLSRILDGITGGNIIMLIEISKLAITMSITRNGKYTRNPIKNATLSSESMYAGISDVVEMSARVMDSGSEVSIP